MLQQQVTSSSGRQGGNMEIQRKRHIKVWRGNSSSTENCKECFCRNLTSGCKTYRSQIPQLESIYLGIHSYFTWCQIHLRLSNTLISTCLALSLLMDYLAHWYPVNNSSVWNHTLLKGDTFLSFGSGGLTKIAEACNTDPLTCSKLCPKVVKQGLLSPPTSQANNIFTFRGLLSLLFLYPFSIPTTSRTRQGKSNP